MFQATQAFIVNDLNLLANSKIYSISLLIAFEVFLQVILLTHWFYSLK